MGLNLFNLATTIGTGKLQNNKNVVLMYMNLTNW